MLLTRQARGHASEHQAVLAALGQAAELCAQRRSERSPHWLYWIAEERFTDTLAAATSIWTSHSVPSPASGRRTTR
ncbi:hypothetical protein [Streptomyces sp. NPDC023838]|uniref:hypothetical protein n=1 Tax=Streptomyces sp. NPDC023838 TaxID=3154325 RepID=UPI0033D4A02B